MPGVVVYPCDPSTLGVRRKDQFMAGIDLTVIFEADLGFLSSNTNSKKTQKALWS